MRMPVIFSGHGDPMIALRDDNVTKTLKAVGEKVLENYGKPKAILAISAHWFTHGNLIQNTLKPQQINDMFGFPEELYQIRYLVQGYPELAGKIQNLAGETNFVIDNDWGIDHGVWTIFVHMFPERNIPVVEMSVNVDISGEEIFEIGKKISALRDDGFLIFGSGNIVHNLREVEWENPNGSEKTLQFNDFIIDAVKNKKFETTIDWQKIPNADYAIPTSEHYLPLIYCIGAADNDDATIFNNVCNLGSMSMTGFIWEQKCTLGTFLKDLAKKFC